VDITLVNDEGINPLIAASSEGHADVVKVLLAVGTADINAKDKDGTNALMAASVRGHKSVVELLLQSKSNVNDQNVDGHTALMFAYNGKNQVETLLDKYAEYLKDGSDNSTKIIKEALQTHVDVVQLLIANGADASLKDKEGHVAADFDYKPATAVESSAGGEGAAVGGQQQHTEL
jgi:serine/threonine-protein phosphatase 6 regulatory ankyrin repeat subunit B